MQRTANPFIPVQFRSRPLLLFCLLLLLILPKFSYSHSITHRILKLGDTEVGLVIHEFNPTKFVMMNVHQNEVTSKEAGMKVAQKYGGKLLYILHGDETQRNISFTVGQNSYAVDPNRIFSNKGIKDILTLNSKYSLDAFLAVKRFAYELLSYVDVNKIIIALHNNMNSRRYSFNTYFFPPSSLGVARIQPSINCTMPTSCADSGEFFYVTSPEMFRYLQEYKMLNVVLQNNDTVADDGSLSVYAGRRSINYVNSEAKHGHLEQQVQMLNVLQSYDLINEKAVF